MVPSYLSRRNYGTNFGAMRARPYRFAIVHGCPGCFALNTILEKMMASDDGYAA